MGGALKSISQWMERLQQSSRERLRETCSLRGFHVAVENTRPDISTAAVLERLDEALALIERYQPWRLRHLRRDLLQFWIVRYPCRGAYFPAQRTCMIELTFLARRDLSAAQVAASVIHEGMHARVDQRRLRTESRDRAREERLCRRAEIDFGRALPPDLGAPIVERAEAIAVASDEEVAPRIDWREAALRQYLIDLDASPLPHWVKRTVGAVARYRVRAAQARAKGAT